MRSFRASPDPMYQLRSPWLAPCALGEAHTVGGSLQTVTLIYGSWDPDQPHIRVTTWRDLPGQDFTPDTPAALLTASPDAVTVDIDGHPTPATLTRLPPETWLLRADPTPLHHLQASGHGPLGDLSFHPLTDLAPTLTTRPTSLPPHHPNP